MQQKNKCKWYGDRDETVYDKLGQKKILESNW